MSKIGFNYYITSKIYKIIYFILIKYFILDFLNINLCILELV